MRYCFVFLLILSLFLYLTAAVLYFSPFPKDYLPPSFLLAQVLPGPNEAVFYFSPSSGNYSAGSGFSVQLMVSASSAITSVKAYLNFNPAVLSVSGVDTSSSIFTSWWESVYNSTTGKVQLQASLASPGYIGNGGMVAAINFQAAAAGSSNLTYDASSLVLRSDDSNILNLARSETASFTVSSPPPPPPGGDTAPPYTLSHNPSKGAANVASSTNIYLQVKDDGAGVNTSAIAMTVEGVSVVPAIAGSPASYSLTYNPSANFSYGQVVDVTIDARDLASPVNTMTRETYSFTIESAPSPPPPPPGCIDTGLGSPQASPASPSQGSGFSISCPAAGSGYDCVTAYAGSNLCSFSSWSGNTAVFSCSALTAGSYASKCKASAGTASNCCPLEKTGTFNVNPPAGGGGGGGGGGDGGGGDIDPPVISGIKISSIASSSAIIFWTTNEPSTSQVEYGTTKNYGSSGALNSVLTTSHSVKISGLSQKTSYYFRAVSKDGSGNSAKSGENNFSTGDSSKLIGDFNSDGKVNIYDFSILLSNWKKTKTPYDLSGDDIVNVFDLSVFLSNWTG